MKKPLHLILLFLGTFLSILSQKSFSQQTIGFNDLITNQSLGRSFLKDGFIFSISSLAPNNNDIIPVVPPLNLGFQNSIALSNTTDNPNPVTRWRISTENGSEFRLLGVFLRSNSGSSSGTIRGFKDGQPTGIRQDLDFNGLKDFPDNPDFYNVDVIEIEGIDLSLFVDEFTHGPAFVVQPSISSATYNASTGQLVVTGARFVSAAGASNDVVTNRIRIRGQGNGTYTLTDTPNAEISSSTTFNLALSASDRLGLSSLLNKNGLSSGDNTTYNLEALEDWLSGADPALTIADLENNSITVSDVPEPPILTASGGKTIFDRGDPPVPIDPNLVLESSDPTFAAALFQITSGYQNVQDVLSFTNNNPSTFGNITASFDAGTGALTLTSAGGTASVSQMQAAMRAVTYRNSSTTPVLGDKTISISVNDGSFNSNVASKTIEVVSINNAPTDIILSSTSINENVAANSAVGTFSAVDPDGDTAFTFSFSAGLLSDDNSAFTISGNNLIINSSPDFENKSNYFIRIRVTDEGGESFEKTFVITVVVPSPVVTNVTSSNVNGFYNIGDQIFVVINFSQPLVVNTSGGSPTLGLETGLTDGLASYLSGSGSTALVFTYTVQEGSVTSDLDYTSSSSLTLNGGTIRNVADQDAILTLPSPGAAGSLGANKSLVLDGIRPTATLVVSDTQLIPGETTTLTTTFSEAVSGLTAADFTVANGTLSGLSSADGGVTWTATLTPSNGVEDQTNVITLDNSGYTDLAGNAGTSTTNSNNYEVDTRRPTSAITISDTQLTVGETTTVAITFSEAVSGLTVSDFTVANGSLSGLSSADGGFTWTATLTPDNGVEDQTNIITLDNTSYQDLAGNTGAGTTDSNNYAVDTQRPTANITVSDTQLKVGETTTVTFTFSEAVSGLTVADFTVANGSLSGLSTSDGGITWTATFTPDAGVEDGTNQITLDNTGYQDAAGNAGTGTTDSNNYVIDTRRPTATLVVSDTQLALGETTILTISFSEAVSGLTTADFTVANGTLSGLSSSDGGVTWTAMLTPTNGVEDPTNVITLDNAGYTDLAGNPGTGTTDSNNYAIDTRRPTATITVSDTQLTVGETTTVTITFSEAVSGLSLGDFIVSNGLLGAFDTDDNMTYTAILTPLPNTEDATNVIRLDNTGYQDAAGNTEAGTTDSNNYLVDTQPPLVNTRNITVQLNATGTVSIQASQVDNNSTDGFGIQSITVSQTDFDCTHVGDNTVTLTVTDVNGNTATGTATVTVEDKIAPVVTTRNLTIQLDAAGTATITAADINDGSTDACGIASLTLSKSTFDCSNIGSNTVTLTVTDVNGNTATGTATVTVEDKIAPVVITRNLTIQLDAAGTATIRAADINNGSTDACGIASLTLSKSTFDCSNIGSNTVTLTITDVNGNTATGTATVTVEDKIAPVVITGNLTIQLDAAGTASITAAQLNNGSTDACGIASLTLSKSTFDCSNIGSNTVTLTVTDVNGKTATGTATVTVEDKTAPVVITRNLTIQLDATGTASITAAQLNNGSTDACGIASLALSKSTFDCSNIGSNTVTLKVTDVNGNTATGTATVTVEDKLAPVPSQTQLPVITAVCSLDTLTPPKATDNCQGTLVATTVTVLPISESTVVTWIFTDPNGNQTEQIQEVRIVDGTAPEITEVPEDFEVILYSDMPFVMPDFTQIAAASDNCKLVSFTQTPLSGTVYSQPGEVVVTLTAGDSFNNETKVSFTITLSNRLIIGLENPEMITVPWNTPPAAISLPASVPVTLSNGAQTDLPVSWNLTGYNPLLAAVYPLTGTLQLGDIENPQDFKPTLLILVQDKIPPTDIALSNSEFGANTSTNQAIGTLSTTDAQDNIHTYGLVNVTGNDGQYFRIEGNQLYLNTVDPLPGKTQFTIVVRSTDRVGNSIEKTFVLNRTRIPVDEVEIFNSFTPNGDGINDTWGIPDLQYFQGGRVQVFDRSGQRIFYTESPADRWDGTFEGKEMPVGSYIWILESKETGEVRRGVLTLLRD
ncbi:MAG: gliding motility-associated C-terminal domain-containing protein [Flavobacteriales bacterium]|nr:gliding motility-associated C-terminal domain-containing protein [Flavobacteriales bacterium]